MKHKLGIKNAGRNINNLRYADDNTLTAENKEEQKSLLMKVKEDSEKAGLKLNILKMKIMEPVCCSMSSSNCCFLTYIQMSQEEVRWSGIPMSKNFPQFAVIHTVKGFSVVNKAEVDIFLEFSCFLYDPADVGNLISGSSAFSKSSLNIWKSWFRYC